MKTLIVRMYNGKSWVKARGMFNINTLDDVGEGLIKWFEDSYKATAYAWWIEEENK